MRRSKLSLLTASLVAAAFALSGCSLPFGNDDGGGGASNGDGAGVEQPANMPVGGVTFTADGVVTSDETPSLAPPPETDAVDVALIFDPMCPHCALFEETFGPALNELVDSGDITLTVYPLAFVVPNPSATSVNAFMAVTSYHPEVTQEFQTLLLAANSQTNGAGLNNDELIELASSLGADSPEVAEAIENGVYQVAIDMLNEQLLGKNFPETNIEVLGTPMVIVEGREVPLDQMSPDAAALLALLQG